MKIKHTIVAAVAAIISSTAMADLTGTTMDLTLTQSGLAGDMAGPTGGVHTYGGTDTFSLLGGPSWDAISPAALGGFDNAIELVLTNFQYASYAVLGPSTSTFDVAGLAEDVEIGSAAVFLPGDLSTNIALITTETGNSFGISWDVQTVVNSNPGAPSVIVGWDSVPVPAPGPAMLLGLAGILPLAGRRRK